MNITAMEPMVPDESVRALEDEAAILLEESNRIASRLHPILRDSIGDLVRSMNCYYSNLIEGHDTHPRDIDRALANDFSSEPKKRDLQKEAIAHIHVQKLIDTGQSPDAWPTSPDYALWLHREFCARLPPDMLWVAKERTGEKLPLIPGAWREHDVQVGRHIPPDHGDLPRFMTRFNDAYAAPMLNRFRQIQTVGAAHHRFLWIHPFLDGNGRVARLMSHALFNRLGIGTSLWSVARGLAREDALYKALLMRADGPREGDRDGRGNLTQRGLIEFCRFFLAQSIDQIRFMSDLLEPSTLRTRIDIHIKEEIQRQRLPDRSFEVLQEAVIAGEVERSRIPYLTGLKERGARNVTAALVQRGMLTSPSQRAPLRLAFPAEVAERWFPNLYPANAGSRS